MLRRLFIKDFLLIQQSEVLFTEGLNVITGETGVGKTACIQAISLLLGQKADTKLIRQGKESACIEASFDVSEDSALIPFLEKQGIDFDPSEMLTIKRELTASGKSRSFINSQMIPASLLKTIGQHLIEIIGQQSAFALRSEETQLHLLDSFGDLFPLRDSFAKAYQKQKIYSQKLKALQEDISHSEREREFCKHQLDEISEVDFKPGEEEEVYQSYKRMTHSKQLAESASEITNLLDSSVLPHLSKIKTIHSQISEIDASLTGQNDFINSAQNELKELSYFFNRYLSSIDLSSKELDEMDNRLSKLNQLKKKYGNSYEEIQNTKLELEKRLDYFTSLENQIEESEKSYVKAEKEADRLAAELSRQRKLMALSFSQKMMDELRDLNLNKARVHIELSPSPRTLHGDDNVMFFLSANPGEKPAAFKEKVSGGELSRLLLSMKILLAEKQRTPTLIFDEIDANIGGETATLVGKKFIQLSKYHQLLCITHFPQVACQACTHISFSKRENEGRTITTIHSLTPEAKKLEIHRMRGGDKAQKWIR